jgi:hypothetical protein
MESDKVLGKIIEDANSPSFDVFKFQSSEDISPGAFVSTLLGSNFFLLGRVTKAQSKNSARVYEADSLEQGFVKNDEIVFSEPTDTARPGAPVSFLKEKVIAQAVGFGANSRSSIDIGIAGHCRALLRPETLARHVFIGGTTGSGKSFAAGILIEELTRLKIPVVVMDSQGEYAALAQDLQGEILKPGKDYAVRLSSFTEEEAAALTSSLKGTLGYELFHFSFLALKKEMFEGRRAEFGLSDLLKRMEMDAPALGADGYQMRLATSRTDASVRRHEFLGALGKKLNWAALLKRGVPVCVDCSRLELLQVQLITGATMRELQKLRLDNKVPSYVLVLDEAHLLVPADTETPCKQIIRENVRIGRHYGICVVLITQNPLDIDRKTIAQCNTRLIFALEPDQLSALQGVKADIAEDIFRKIPKMPRGTCLLSGTHETVRHAVMVRIRSDRKTRYGGT